MRAWWVPLLITACAHEPPRVTLHETQPLDPETRKADVRAWSELADSLTKEVGALEYGTASFSLARSAFFDDGSALLHADAARWLEQVAHAFAGLAPGAYLVVTTTFEDDTNPTAARKKISDERAAALTTTLARNGVDGAHAEVRSSVAEWEGSYDGPAVLDPAEGRINFAIVRREKR